MAKKSGAERQRDYIARRDAYLYRLEEALADVAMNGLTDDWRKKHMAIIGRAMASVGQRQEAAE